MTAALFDVLLLRNLLRPLNNLNDTFQVAKLFYTARKVSNIHNNSPLYCKGNMICFAKQVIWLREIIFRKNYITMHF